MDNKQAVMPLGDYKAICDAVRSKNGSADTYKSGELAAAIDGIETGGGGHTGHVDADGLRGIGWTDEEIARFQAHVWWDEEYDYLWSVEANGVEAFPIIIRAISNGNEKAIAAVIRGYDSATTYLIRYYYLLRYLDLTNAKFSHNTRTYFLNRCYNLKTVVGLENFFKNAGSGTSMMYSFYYANNLTTIDLGDADTSKITNLCFRSCGVKEIKGVLDLTSNNISELFTSAGTNFPTTNSLVKAKIKNPTVNIDVSQTMLDHESLLYLLENLGEHELTLTLGAELLAKLTDDEKAIAINKGWTLA